MGHCLVYTETSHVILVDIHLIVLLSKS